MEYIDECHRSLYDLLTFEYAQMVLELQRHDLTRDREQIY